MTDDLREEFSALHEQVTTGLRNRVYLGAVQGDCVAQLLVLPAFQNPAAYDIIRAVREEGRDEYKVMHSCWRRDLDLPVFQSPVDRMRHPRPFRPTVVVLDAPVASDTIRGFMEELRALSVPLHVEPAARGVDGVTFEIAFGGFWANARIGWWVEPPTEWRPFDEVLNRMLERFGWKWT
jgi:hypothetical protein